MGKVKNIEFDSRALLTPDGNFYRRFRVDFDRSEILCIEDLDTQEPFEMHELPTEDQEYISERVAEWRADQPADPDDGVDQAYDEWKDRQLLD